VKGEQDVEVTEGHILHSIENGEISINVRLPEPGEYALNVMAKEKNKKTVWWKWFAIFIYISTGHIISHQQSVMCVRGFAAMKFKQKLSNKWKSNNSSHNTPLPPNSREEWGPGEDTKDMGMVALTHRKGQVEADDGDAEIKFSLAKELEFKHD
jgi:hypothetical protein